jgi:hypothetical protein
MQATIQFPSFMAKAMIEPISGSHAFILTGIAASLNLEEETWPVDPVETNIMDIVRHPRETLQLQMPVHAHKSTHAIIIALGIEFFYEVRGHYQPVEKKHNALAVIKVFPADEV